MEDIPSTQLQVVQTDSATMLAVIAKAAADPNTDINKVEKFLDLYRAMQRDKAQVEFFAALSEMQDELPSIKERGGIKNRDGVIQSTYALWEDVNKAIKPVLKKHGFALSFKVKSDDKAIAVTGVLSHKGGHKEDTTITLPSDISGNKNAVQAVASSVSYGKRYTAGALLNLVSHGEDDDGQAGTGPTTIDEKQAADLEALISEVKANKSLFLKHFKIGTLEQMPVAVFNDAVKMLRDKGRAAKPEAKK